MIENSLMFQHLLEPDLWLLNSENQYSQGTADI